MTSFPDDEDGRVLADLFARGCDLSSETDIEFAIAVPDESTARRVASSIPDKYRTETYFDEGEPDYQEGVDDEEFGPSWTVYAIRRSTPSHAFLVESQEELKAIVTTLGGSLDGWGFRF